MKKPSLIDVFSIRFNEISEVIHFLGHRVQVNPNPRLS